MSKKSSNVLEQPIDFKFLFIDRLTSAKDLDKEKGHYKVSATCRAFDGDSYCHFVVWHIHDIDAKKTLSGEKYHLMKDAVMREYDDRSIFKRTIIAEVQQELNKIHKNKFYFDGDY